MGGLLVDPSDAVLWRWRGSMSATRGNSACSPGPAPSGGIGEPLRKKISCLGPKGVFRKGPGPTGPRRSNCPDDLHAPSWAAPRRCQKEQKGCKAWCNLGVTLRYADSAAGTEARPGVAGQRP